MRTQLQRFKRKSYRDRGWAGRVLNVLKRLL